MSNRSSSLQVILTTLVISFLQPHSSFSQTSSSIRSAHWNLNNKLAMDGYDPVSYFTSSGPQKGNSTISHQYLGVTYYFSNEANKKTFISNPAKYEPQYGGWCAYAMGDRGEKVEVNPETFKIVNGKLFLFYNHGKYNMLLKWNEDQEELLHQADDYWQNILKNEKSSRK